MHQTTRTFAFAAFLLSVTFSRTLPLPAADTFATGIDNFGRINENYYRGGQPSRKALDNLRNLGVRTVIDLQENALREEAAWVREAGMQYFNLKLSSRHAASPDETEHFLKLVGDPANWPVFVHCAGGRHRTGEMTAIYRISHDFWTADQAYEEMKKYDYYSFGGHGSLRDHVYQYYRDFLAGAVAKEILPVEPSK